MTSKHGKHNPGLRLLAINQMLKLQCRDPYLYDGRSRLLSRYPPPHQGGLFNILILPQLLLFLTLDSMRWTALSHLRLLSRQWVLPFPDLKSPYLHGLMPLLHVRDWSRSRTHSEFLS